MIRDVVIPEATIQNTKKVSDEGWFVVVEPILEGALESINYHLRSFGLEIVQGVMEDGSAISGDYWLRIEKKQAKGTKPICPECECETIVMAISRNLLYKVNSVRLGEYEGEATLEPDDIDQVETDETDAVIYRCTGTGCTFASRDLADFNPN